MTSGSSYTNNDKENINQIANLNDKRMKKSSSSGKLGTSKSQMRKKGNQSNPVFA
jgi:hypothetical protein